MYLYTIGKKHILYVYTLRRGVLSKPLISNIYTRRKKERKHILYVYTIEHTLYVYTTEHTLYVYRLIRKDTFYVHTTEHTLYVYRLIRKDTATWRLV
jgi:hypothetical protein